jgi:ankyrin repeat protein
LVLGNRARIITLALGARLVTIFQNRTFVQAGGFAADNRDRTALMIAAELGDATGVELLIQHSANRAQKDRAGKTAFDLAANDAVRTKLMAR